MASGTLDAATTFNLAERFESFDACALDAARQGRPPADIWTPPQTLINMDVTGVAGQILGPTLILDYEGERFYPGQPTAPAELIPANLVTAITMTAADGAQLHCSPMAPRRHAEVIFSWLERTLRQA